jgi:parvulin-like peptidyl-prolyl isomerase
MMVEEFSKATFALEVGQTTDIVETQFGYHIIRLDEMKKAAVAPFDEVKGDIKDTLTQEQRNKLIAEYFESLKAKATIVYAPGKEPKPAPAPMPNAAPAPQK